jgi:hypothetical protein
MTLSIMALSIMPLATVVEILSLLAEVQCLSQAATATVGTAIEENFKGYFLHENLF